MNRPNRRADHEAVGAELRRAFGTEIDRHRELAETTRRDAEANGEFYVFLDPAEHFVEVYRRCGTTVADIHRVEALAAWAHRQQTALAQPVGFGNDPFLSQFADLFPEPTISQTALDLLDRWGKLSAGLPGLDAAAWPWLVVLAGAPDQAARRRMNDALLPAQPSFDEYLAWRRIGPSGPVAYAVGLTLAEALERDRTGSLNVAALRALAGLQGWQFPPENLLG